MAQQICAACERSRSAAQGPRPCHQVDRSVIPGAASGRAASAIMAVRVGCRGEEVVEGAGPWPPRKGSGRSAQKSAKIVGTSMAVTSTAQTGDRGRCRESASGRRAKRSPRPGQRRRDRRRRRRPRKCARVPSYRRSPRRDRCARCHPASHRHLGRRIWENEDEAGDDDVGDRSRGRGWPWRCPGEKRPHGGRRSRADVQEAIGRVDASDAKGGRMVDDGAAQRRCRSRRRANAGRRAHPASAQRAARPAGSSGRYSVRRVARLPVGGW